MNIANVIDMDKPGKNKMFSLFKRMNNESRVSLAVFVVLALLPLIISGYPIYIIPKYMMYGILAISLSLIWGFGGIVSFGQAAFFAIGAYAFGIWIGGDSHILESIINPAYIGFVLAIILPGIIAFVAGFFLFSGGVRGAYFVILTLALSIIVEQGAINESQLTGGWNGLFITRPELSLPFIGSFSIEGNIAFYYFALPLVMLIYVLARAIIDNKIGKILMSIRENEDRTLALGFNTALYKTVIFGLSGAVAGIAGAGYAVHSNFIDPTIAGVLFSTEVIVWVAIAGRYSLIAAFLGGLIVPTLTDYASAISPQYWQLGVAIVFILVVALSKGGIAEFISRRVASKNQFKDGV